MTVAKPSEVLRLLITDNYIRNRQVQLCEAVLLIINKKAPTKGALSLNC